MWNDDNGFIIKAIIYFFQVHCRTNPACTQAWVFKTFTSETEPELIKIIALSYLGQVDIFRIDTI